LNLITVATNSDDESFAASGSITPMPCSRVQFMSIFAHCMYVSKQRDCELHAEARLASHGEPIAYQYDMRFQILAVLITTSGFVTAQRPSSAGGLPEHHWAAMSLRRAN
jgi:hypothetical protein